MTEWPRGAGKSYAMTRQGVQSFLQSLKEISMVQKGSLKKAPPQQFNSCMVERVKNGYIVRTNVNADPRQPYGCEGPTFVFESTAALNKWLAKRVPLFDKNVQEA